MVSQAVFRKYASGFAEVTEEPHFKKASFLVRKKIFTTLDTRYNKVCVKLTEADQAAFTAMAPETIYAVPDKWGKMGWTYLDLGKITKPQLKAILTAAYCTVAPKVLGKQYF